MENQARVTFLSKLIGGLRLSGAAGRRNEPVAGVVWVTLAMAFLAGLVALGRYAALEGLHPMQVMFFRNFFCVLWMLPLLAWRGLSLVQTKQPKLYGLRVLLSFTSMTAMFYAASLIPIGNITAIGFLSPLFGTLFAVFLLGETVRLRRWTALLVGLIGALVILRPGMMGVGAGQLAALVSAMALGLIGPVVKKLTHVDDADRVVFITNVMLLLLSIPPALFVWQWPPQGLWPALTGLGLCAVLGHMCLVRGYAAADASLVMTFKFSRLPFAVILGFWLFGETIDIWTAVGALIIFAASVYIARREAQLKAAEAPHEPASGAIPWQ